MGSEKVVGDHKLPTSAASKYLRQLGMSIEPTTLKQWRWLEKGPAYYRELGRVYYRPADLDAFSTSSVQRIEPGGKAVEGSRSAEVRQPYITQPSA